MRPRLQLSTGQRVGLVEPTIYMSFPVFFSS